MKEYKWVSIGCGVIANELANSGVKLYGVANRSYDKAVAYANKYGVEKVYDNIDDVYKDKDVDIIYISTPHNTHISFLRKAISAGKHVLCEKSITLNSKELEEAVKLAKKNNVVLAEAMTIYHMPIYKELKRRIDNNEFGKLNLIQMNFGSFKEYDENNRFFNLDLAGGALLDIGTYALSFARYFLSSMPEEILSTVKKAKTGVDEKSGIILKTKEDEIATISLAFRSKMPKRGIVSCDNGFITIDNFPRANKATINYLDGAVEVIECGEEEKALDYEVIFMEERIKENKESNSLELTYDVTKIMNKVRKDWGIFYPFENN